MQTAEVRRRKRGAGEPTHSLTLRVTARAADTFIAWCERERLTYREGFDRLVGRITKGA
jgi:hypothetical protein